MDKNKSSEGITTIFQTKDNIFYNLIDNTNSKFFEMSLFLKNLVRKFKTDFY